MVSYFEFVKFLKPVNTKTFSSNFIYTGPKQPKSFYVKQSFKSGCCSGPNQIHEQCNCKAHIDFCKDACDHDPNCKGYVGHGKSYCQIATTSTCPTTNGCAKFQIGNVAINQDLDGSISCGSGYHGCYIKQSG